MLQAATSNDRAWYQGPLRHPIWMFIGAVIGLASAVGGMAITEWLVPGAAGSQSLLIPVMTTAMGATLFRRSVPNLPTWWSLFGFPLLAAIIVFLGALSGAFMPATNPAAILIAAVVLASIAFSGERRVKPTPLQVRRGYVVMTGLLAALLPICIAIAVAAYAIPVPQARAALPAAAAYALGVWLSLSLIALAWMVTDRFSLTSQPSTDH